MREYAPKKVYLTQKPPQIYYWYIAKKKIILNKHKLKFKLPELTTCVPTFLNRRMIFSCDCTLLFHQWQVWFKFVYPLLLMFVPLLGATILQLCWVKCLPTRLLGRILLTLLKKNIKEIKQIIKNKQTKPQNHHKQLCKILKNPKQPKEQQIPK